MTYRIAIVKTTYRPDIIGQLVAGAAAVFDEKDLAYETFDVHGALEIPAAVAMLDSKKGFDGYLALGCIIKGETIHDEVIAYTAFKALDELAREELLPVGNGILTVNTIEQAEARAHPDKLNRGAEAARAVIDMINLKEG